MRQENPVNWVHQLQRSPRIEGLDPVAVRFLYSLRLIALYRRARRDPVAELAARLGSITVAIATLDLAESLCAMWPDSIQVSRACCQCLTHDEVTFGAMMQAAAARDRIGFSHQLEGLVSAQRIDILWEQSLSLVASEYAALQAPA